MDRIRNDTRVVQVRLATAVHMILPAKITREVPAASKELPSLALSLEGGGGIALDPREKDGTQAFESLFQFEIELTDKRVERIGERVFVRFEHHPEPLAHRWYRGVRRLFMKRFNV